MCDSSLRVGVDDAVEEILGIEHLAQPFVVVGVTFVPNLRGRGGMVGIAVLVGQRVATRNRTRVGALHLGERFAHQPEAHVLDVTDSFEFDCAAHKNRLLILGFDISTIGLSTLRV